MYALKQGDHILTIVEKKLLSSSSDGKIWTPLTRKSADYLDKFQDFRDTWPYIRYGRTIVDERKLIWLL